MLSRVDPPLTVSFREYRFTMIRHAIFGEDCFRFAAMLGE
jgi:hypothetical protein